jgi:ferredoxin
MLVAGAQIQEHPWRQPVTEDPPLSLRVHVDRDKCQGHNRCYALAPELFDIDDFGFSSERDDGIVPGDLVDKARLAVANCPEYAISMSEIEVTR